MEKTIELISASISDRGLSEKRPQNEDSFAELPQFGVFAVADGVGGAQAGDFASQMAMELLTEAVSNRPDTSDAEELFRVAIAHANRSIHQMATDLPQLASMATTIVALHLNGNIATLAHVGDSRIYRFTPDGQLYRETMDHSVVEEEVRAGRMTKEEALVHPSRNVISRALGAEDTVDIELKTIMVEPNTTFLLCSDGITRHVSDEELQQIFATAAQPQLICEHLKELCYSRGAEDNLTAVIVRTFAEPDDVEEDILETTFPVIEDETISTARAAFAAGASESVQIPKLEIDDTWREFELDEIETGEFELKSDSSAEPATEVAPQVVETLDDTVTDEQFLLTEIDEEAGEESTAPDPDSYVSSSVVVPAQAKKDAAEFVIFSNNQQYITPTVGAGHNRILISLGLLLLGGVIAVALSYLLGFSGQQQEAVAPQIQTMQTNNIPLTAFEESRRLVDSNPEKYQTTNSTITPRDAGEHYLLARAMLLTDKPNEARSQLQQAREKLPQVDDAERKTLSAEIALAQSVVENPQALEAFKKAISGQ